MGRKKCVSALIFLFLTSNVFASQKIDGNLQVTGLGGGGTLCVHSDNSGNLTTAAADCGSGSGGQTPWTSDINGGGYALSNATGNISMWTNDSGYTTISGTQNDFVTIDSTGTNLSDLGYSLSTDGTMAANSSSLIPSQSAVVSYIPYSILQGITTGRVSSPTAYLGTGIMLGVFTLQGTDINGNSYYDNQGAFLFTDGTNWYISNFWNPQAPVYPPTSFGTYFESTTGITGAYTGYGGWAADPITITGDINVTEYQGYAMDVQEPTPSVYPSSQYDYLYFKNDDNLYKMTSAGTEQKLLTGNQSITTTLSGAVTGSGSGTTSIGITTSGINWDNVKNVATAGVNWNALTLFNGSINWDTIKNLGTAGINWNYNTFKSVGINWEDIKNIGNTGINWNNLKLYNAGINWDDIRMLGSKTTNWDDLTIISRYSITTPASNTITTSATPAINVDTTRLFTITALSNVITSMSSGLTGTPKNGQCLIIRILDAGVAKGITWGASYTGIVPLPTTTVAGKYLYVGFIYNSADSTWHCISVVEQ